LSKGQRRIESCMLLTGVVSEHSCGKCPVQNRK
jgi:hypothetical protein